MTSPIHSESKTVNYWDYIPDELVVKIFRELNLCSLGRVLLVSRRFAKVGKDASIWTRYHPFPQSIASKNAYCAAKYARLNSLFQKRALISHPAAISCLQINPTREDRLFSGSEDGTLTVHLLTENRGLRKKAHPNGVGLIQFNPLNHNIITAASDCGSLCTWDLKANRGKYLA